MRAMGLFVLLAFAVGASSASALVIKTEDSDVNVWVNPGKIGLETVDVVKAHEEVTVIGKTKMPSGKTWYEVAIRRFPNNKLVTTRGWVDAKYFKTLTGAVIDRKSEAEFRETCQNCRRKQFRIPVDQASPNKKVSPAGYIWPVVGTLSSAFGMRWHPVHNRYKMHDGIDLRGNNGKTVHAAKAGKVLTSSHSCRGGYGNCHHGAGNMIQIQHDDGLISEYFHLSANCPFPRVGQRVQQGDPIACVGMTGVATGPHLHFGIIKNGHKVNPLPYLPAR